VVALQEIQFWRLNRYESKGDMVRKSVALAVAATAAGFYTYVVWKRQVAIYREAKARAVDQAKTIALKVVAGSALAMGIYIYLHDNQSKRIGN